MTTITALPTAPNPLTDSQANYNSKALAFTQALPTFVTEANAVAGEVNTNAGNAATSAGTATTQAGIATTQAGNALTSASNAAASALTAVNAPGTSASSTTSLTIGTGAKSLTIETGKSLVAGMSLSIARTAAPANRMIGTVTSYNSGTGALDVTVVAIEGSGTYTDWTVSLTAAADLSAFTRRQVQLKVFDDVTALSTGDGKAIFCIPTDLNGYNLVAAHAFITTVSSSGTPTIQIRNVTDAADMLTTRITIDVSEFSSYTAAAAPVIDAAHDDVATGDLIAIDVDIAGTGTKGLGVMLTFMLP